MLDIFTYKDIVTPAHVGFGQWRYVKHGLLYNYAAIQHVVRQGCTLVHNNHILLKILHAITTDDALDPQSYVDAVANAVVSFHSGLGLVSPVTMGGIHTRGEFYSRDLPEIWISTNAPFDVTSATSDWQNLEPVKVLRHPWNSTSMIVPQGQYTKPDNLDDRSGVSVIAINIPMLALQYRCWRALGLKQTTMTFVTAYPLMNMLRSHADIALFNRVYAVLHGLELERYRTLQQAVTQDYQGTLDVIIGHWIGWLLGRKSTYSEILSELGAVSASNMQHALVLPNTPITRQNEWAFLIARMPVIRMLLQITRKTATESNVQDIVNTRITLQNLLVDRVLQSRFDLGLQAELADIRGLL